MVAASNSSLVYYSHITSRGAESSKLTNLITIIESQFNTGYSYFKCSQINQNPMCCTNKIAWVSPFKET